jgi:hypothetical protein
MMRFPRCRYKSYSETIYPMFMSGKLNFFAYFIGVFADINFFMTQYAAWHFPHEGGFLNREKTLLAFEKHTENMKALIPADRLLVFQV